MAKVESNICNCHDIVQGYIFAMKICFIGHRWPDSCARKQEADCWKVMLLSE